jgi:hypothetical protein
MELNKCGLCNKSDEKLSLLSANHKELGWIKICGECWRESFSENNFIAGSSGSKKKSSSPCSSCKNCCY